MSSPRIDYPHTLEEACSLSVSKVTEVDENVHSLKAVPSNASSTSSETVDLEKSHKGNISVDTKMSTPTQIAVVNPTPQHAEKPAVFSKITFKPKARPRRNNCVYTFDTKMAEGQSNDTSIFRVLPFVSKYLDINNLLSIRNVSREWKKFSDELLAMRCSSGNTTSFCYDLDSLTKLRTFKKTFVTKLPSGWNVFLGRRVKFFPGDLDSHETPSDETYWKNVTWFLKIFGADVWYCTIKVFECESTKLVSILRDCLQYLPNLREFEVEHLTKSIKPPNNEYVNYQEYKNSHVGVSQRSALKFVKLYGVHEKVSYLLLYCSQAFLKGLSLHNCDLNMLKWLEFSRLEELDIWMLRDKHILSKVKFANNPPLKWVRLAYEDDSVDVQELVEFLNQFKASLEHLTLSVGVDHIKNLEMLLKLDLRKVQTVELNWSKVVSFDFLQVFENSLKHIKLENCIAQDEGLLQLRGVQAEDTLHQARVWEKLPCLTTISIHNDFGNGFNKQFYSRSMYEFLKQSSHKEQNVTIES